MLVFAYAWCSSGLVCLVSLGFGCCCVSIWWVVWVWVWWVGCCCAVIVVMVGRFWFVFVEIVVVVMFVVWIVGVC